MFKKIGLIVLSLLLFAITVLAQTPGLSVQVSSRKVGLQEQFQLTVSVVNPTGRYSFLEPKMKDFRVLSGPHESTNTNYSNLNGRAGSQITVSYTYLLQPLRQGTFTIGPAAIRLTDGTELASEPVRIQVTAERQQAQRPATPSRGGEDDFFDEMDRQMEEMMKRQQQMMRQFFEEPEAPPELPIEDYSQLTEDHLHENIFIRAEVDKNSVYLGQQVNVVYKLYTRLKMSLTPTILPALNGFWAQEIQRQPDTYPVQENYKGRRYNVFVLKKTALFPQQSGMLQLDQAKAEGTVEVSVPAGGGSYRFKTIPVSVESPLQQLEVKPLPLPQPEHFTGGVGHFGLSASIQPQQLTTDEVIQLTLYLKGTGNLGLITAPELSLPPGLTAATPESQDSITELLPGLSGTRRFVYQISADRAGHYTIPSVALSYFDPASGQYQTLHTEPYELDVKQGTKAPAAETDTLRTQQDIHGLETRMPDFKAGNGVLLQQAYYWIIYGLGVLLLGLLLWRDRRRQHRRQYADQYRKKRANKEAWKRLAAARSAMQAASHTVFYEEVSKAIWLYLSDKLGIPISTLSKDNLAQKLRFRAIDTGQIDRTLALITECEMALYSPDGGQQQQQSILEEASELIGIFETQFKQNKG